MKFFDIIQHQQNKKNYSVCGDHCLCERTPAGTIYVLCDGIGSGIYANISAIFSANHILELITQGMSPRIASETVAASMHRARSEDMQFAAFTVVYILPDGQYTIYSYEAPNPIILQYNHATVPTPRFYTAGFEVISEITGTLINGDALLLFSDGVSQAGMGHGLGMGVGSEGIANFINRNFEPDDDIDQIASQIMDMCRSVSAGNYEDDSTLALIHCRDANELTLLTGPPSKQSLDHTYATDFMEMPGKKIICGSTTTDILARELNLQVNTLSMGNSFGQPPEYEIPGIDLVTEGAITLNQAYNILDEPLEKLNGNSLVERLCIMLKSADVIHLMIGNASNTAHDDLIFKQIGVHIRKSTIQQIAQSLKNSGKLVIERSY